MKASGLLIACSILVSLVHISNGWPVRLRRAGQVNESTTEDYTSTSEILSTSTNTVTVESTTVEATTTVLLLTSRLPSNVSNASTLSGWLNTTAGLQVEKTETSLGLPTRKLLHALPSTTTSAQNRDRSKHVNQAYFLSMVIAIGITLLMTFLLVLSRLVENIRSRVTSSTIRRPSREQLSSPMMLFKDKLVRLQSRDSYTERNEDLHDVFQQWVIPPLTPTSPLCPPVDSKQSKQILLQGARPNDRIRLMSPKEAAGADQL